MRFKIIITILELLFIFLFIVIPVSLYLIAAYGPRVHKIKTRVVCGKNLKDIGTAMTMYAENYKENFLQLPGTGPWSKDLGFDYYLDNPDFKPGGAQSNSNRTISASWYLLIKYADVSPKLFVCPTQKTITKFDGSNPDNRDIAELWDFGSNPYKHVSYSMHNPYSRYPADYRRSAAFAIAADMSPYFDNGDIIKPSIESFLPESIWNSRHFIQQLYNSINHNSEIEELRKAEIRRAEAEHHDTNLIKNKKYVVGQQVLYADGHNSWEARPDVGIRNDNIYTYWMTKPNSDPNELDKRVGQPPTGRSPENDAKSKEDSFLAI